MRRRGAERLAEVLAAEASSGQVGQALEAAGGGGSQQVEGGGGGHGVEGAVGGHDRHAGDEGREGFDAAEGGEAVGRGLGEAHDAGQGHGHGAPAGRLAAPGGAADEVAAGGVAVEHGAVVVEELGRGESPEPQLRMGALAGAAAAHEDVGAAAEPHGRGVDDEVAGQGDVLGEEDAGHRVDDEVGKGVGGPEPQGGRLQVGGHEHQTRGLAGARSEHDGPVAGGGGVYGGAAQVVDRFGEGRRGGQLGLAAEDGEHGPGRSGGIGGIGGIGLRGLIDQEGPEVGRHRGRCPGRAEQTETALADFEAEIHSRSS